MAAGPEPVRLLVAEGLTPELLLGLIPDNANLLLLEVGSTLPPQYSEGWGYEDMKGVEEGVIISQPGYIGPPVQLPIPAMPELRDSTDNFLDSTDNCLWVFMAILAAALGLLLIL